MKVQSVCSTVKSMFATVFCVSVLSGALWAATPPVGPLQAPGQMRPKVSGQTLPKGASESWWATVQKQIREDEYGINWSDHTSIKGRNGAWQAYNPAQGFKSSFIESGVIIAPTRKPSQKKQASWVWGLSLQSWGRSGAGNKVRSVIPTVSRNRVDYSRHDIQEWYINTENGLEQGFVLPAPPAGSGVRGEESGEKEDNYVHIDLALAGTLHPKFAEDGKAVDFFDNGNVSVLHYGSLKVTDANGQTLKARMKGYAENGGGIRISVDDRGVVYPITVDPLLTGPTWTATGENSGDEFGYSVATAGDVNGDGYSDVIVGAPGNAGYTGKAYLYLGGPSGLSTASSWTAVGEAAHDHFGWSVATAGDVNGDGYSDVIVGAYGYSSNTGKAYLYAGGPSGLSTSSSWTAVGEPGTSAFGSSVATAGDVNGDGYSDVIVGAYAYSSWTGKAYVYEGGPSGLSTSSSWTAVGEPGTSAFGSSVATAGDVNGDGYSDVIVGAYGFNTWSGKAYLYAGGPSGLSATSSWDTTGENSYDYFGWSVATAGDVNGDGYSDVIVGAYGFNGDYGKAYLYAGGPSGLSATSSWTAVGAATGDYFGYCVATAGDVNGDGYSDVIVGAYINAGNTGKAYLYLGGPSGLSTTPTWTATGENGGDYFGWSVATAGDVNGDGCSDVIVGAYGYSSSTGKAYLYAGGPSGLSTTSSWTAVGEAGDFFSGCVATAGDVNGDGYSDVIVGAYGFNNSHGKVYLYAGGPSGLSTTASWTAVGEAAGDSFGWCVETAGDVNGDGYSDVIVGAHGFNSSQGKAYIYEGGPSGLSSTSSWDATGENSGDDFGWSVATAGDVNGDGYSDVIVGAYYYNSYTGKAYIYEGGPSGLSSTSSWDATGAHSPDKFGYSVATAGDVNGDGYSDVIVGAHGFNSYQGKAYLYTGGPSGLSTTSSWELTGENSNDFFGYSVATAGDVNGDGYSDVIVGAVGFSSNQGKAYLYAGGTSGLSAAFSWDAVGEVAGDRFGRSVATAGDVNGDGYSDVIVGTVNGNKTYLYAGGPTGLSTASSWTATGENSFDVFGHSVATAGDVNGDGYSDVVVGAVGFNSSQGKAYLYLGGGGPGVPVLPRQLRADLSAPIATFGLALDRQFRTRMILRSPFGRGRVKMEWQAVPLGETFNPYWNPIQSGELWRDSQVSGMVNDELVDCAYDGPYKWRARVRYHPSTTPFQSFGRWFTPAANGLQETDLRSVIQVACVEPDEACWIYEEDKSVPDNFPILNWEDWNQANQETGWNVRRSNDPALPKDQWPIVASNIVDGDAGTANYQWTDISGDDPGSGNVWYYEVTAYNANCPAEGPY